MLYKTWYANLKAAIKKMKGPQLLDFCQKASKWHETDARQAAGETIVEMEAKWRASAPRRLKIGLNDDDR